GIFRQQQRPPTHQVANIQCGLRPVGRRNRRKRGGKPPEQAAKKIAESAGLRSDRIPALSGLYALAVSRRERRRQYWSGPPVDDRKLRQGARRPRQAPWLRSSSSRQRWAEPHPQATAAALPLF